MKRAMVRRYKPGKIIVLCRAKRSLVERFPSQFIQTNSCNYNQNNNSYTAKLTNTCSRKICRISGLNSKYYLCLSTIKYCTADMTTILLLETATEVCSAAISRDGEVLVAKETIEGYNHSEKLTVFIEELMEENNIPMANLDAVCVSRGPGSYTGLRIGVSVAKGICYALGKPLISVGTLDALAYQIACHPQHYGLTLNNSTLLCPMIDARRMEVYTALYDYKGTPITGIEARIIDEDSYAHELENQEVIFFGNGAAKCRLALNHHNARFPGEVHASARFMSALASNRYNLHEFEDVAYFEPFYLKDFVATIPKNKLF